MDDPMDFAGFYLATKDSVYRAMLAAGDSRASAEDAVAEAYVRACARWASLKQHPNPTAWVLRTAINVQRSWWRRLRREVPGDPPDHPIASVAEADFSLRALIKELPRRQREVIALRLLADLSAEQTAELLGVAVSTVHVHLHRALVTLREHRALVTLREHRALVTPRELSPRQEVRS